MGALIRPATDPRDSLLHPVHACRISKYHNTFGPALLRLRHFIQLALVEFSQSFGRTHIFPTLRNDPSNYISSRALTCQEALGGYLIEATVSRELDDHADTVPFHISQIILQCVTSDNGLLCLSHDAGTWVAMSATDRANAANVLRATCSGYFLEAGPDSFDDLYAVFFSAAIAHILQGLNESWDPITSTGVIVKESRMTCARKRRHSIAIDITHLNENENNHSANIIDSPIDVDLRDITNTEPVGRSPSKRPRISKDHPETAMEHYLAQSVPSGTSRAGSISHEKSRESAEYSNSNESVEPSNEYPSEAKPLESSDSVKILHDTATSPRGEHDASHGRSISLEALPTIQDRLLTLHNASPTLQDEKNERSIHISGESGLSPSLAFDGMAYFELMVAKYLDVANKDLGAVPIAGDPSFSSQGDRSSPLDNPSPSSDYLSTADTLSLPVNLRSNGQSSSEVVLNPPHDDYPVSGSRISSSRLTRSIPLSNDFTRTECFPPAPQTDFSSNAAISVVDTPAPMLRLPASNPLKEITATVVSKPTARFPTPVNTSEAMPLRLRPRASSRKTPATSIAGRMASATPCEPVKDTD